MAGKTKKYKTVKDLFQSVSSREEAEHFEAEQRSRSLAKVLFTMRNAQEKTQSDIADLMGISQSTVSKLESCDDINFRVGDLLKWADALGHQLTISFHQRRTIADDVKYHACMLKENLDRLADLAHHDEEIADGVTSFFGETLQNFLRFWLKSAEKLPEQARSTRDSPILEVVVPPDMESETICK